MATPSVDRQTLVSIFKDFSESLQSEECKSTLKALAPDEEKMAQWIEKQQANIFKKHNIEPAHGFGLLRRVRELFPGDNDLHQMLMFSAYKEELAIGEALRTTPFQEQMLNVGLDDFMNQLREMQTKGLTADQQQQMRAVVQQQIAHLPVQERQKYLQQLMSFITPEEKQKIQQQVQMMQQQLPNLPADKQAAMQQQIQQMQAYLSASSQPATAIPTTTLTSSSTSTTSSNQAPPRMQGPSVAQMKK